MKFYYGGSKKEAYQNIACNKTFQHLCRYLYQHEQSILRDLKQNITMPDLEKTIDTAIELKLVLRENRRYRLMFPVVSKEMSITITQEDAFQVALKQLREESPANFLAALNYFYNLTQQDHFYGVMDSISLAGVAVLKSEELTLISGQVEESIRTLPQYFDALTKEQEAEKSDLYAIIGDVDPIYAGTQFAYIIQRVEQRKKVRPSIFTQALIMSEILATDESGTLQLKIPTLTSGGKNLITIPSDVFRWQLLFAKLLEDRKDNFIQYILLTKN
ncbi:DUF1803 domain-containing protein [Enterococcus dispar]|uniref:DUF1803 domain-containing protein n=1 Tax=Enterococcus dispar ATCC 51266 TaxID=1139219 RepID=S0KEJ3_9ENTE|nr:DUF1803 domain-containing protein [Enterococcus dispar]EOT43147.1 hypothetical protein OMK_00500 [Enterococcus dispar ATCC 51266]EOW85405.1 hypothetical protein I569_00700 [Enterococcus dispar ATCC 51266]OJG40294.1 hypothetical protein RV01_GL000368 [Enterococcus dispar]